MGRFLLDYAVLLRRGTNFMTVTMIGHKGLPAHSGGIERHVEELSTALVRLGVRVISFDREWYVGNAPSPAGVERRFSYGVASKHLDAITNTFSAIVLARREKPDVIHVHGVGPALLLPIARVLHPRARIVATFHCVDRVLPKWGRVAQFFLHLGESFACLFAHRTITVSDALAAYCLDQYGCQVTSIPNGVRIPHAEPDMDILDGFGLMPGRYFFMAARLAPYKNAHIAVEAHALFAKRRPDLAEAYPLVIAGGSSYTDDYVRELRAFASRHTGVHLIGEQYGEDLAALQAFASCHLSLSSSEGMSLSLLEGMAWARPAIVSDIPQNTSVVGPLAVAVPVGDVETLADAMECAALLTDLERNTMGVALRERVRRDHDWNRIAESTLTVYEEVLGEAALVPATA
jgi:glycosyltransferase involved in cell wall biosynthesis